MVSPVDSMTMVFVPSGDFLMGTSDEPASSVYPLHSRYLDDYWIDSTEVTNAMFLQFVTDTGFVTFNEEQGKGWVVNGNEGGWVDGVSWQHPNGPNSDLTDLGNHPVVDVSWNDATAYCAWAGRRLPTHAEWEKAGRGTDGRMNPWGEGIDCTKANIADCGRLGTSEVGSYPSDMSPYGAFDMAGNVSEYLLDMYEGYYELSAEGDPIPTSDGIHVDARGGSYFDIFPEMELFLVYSSYLESSLPAWGFRCAMSSGE